MKTFLKFLLATALLLAVEFGCSTGTIDEEIVIEVTARVHLCKDLSSIPVKDVVGYAKWNGSTGDVYLVGSTCGGKVVFDFKTLGHEVGHLLAWKDSRLLDPDKEGKW